MLVKFSTLAGGCFIECTESMDRQNSDRCFRFDAEGNAEYAFFGNLIESPGNARWFGHQFKEADFTFA